MQRIRVIGMVAGIVIATLVELVVPGSRIALELVLSVLTAIVTGILMSRRICAVA
jgi:ABC-type uncharacterized transport system permease subunit